jgi:transcriptional regulator with XRE-family HTH domain
MADFPAVARQHREARGMSLRALARALNYDHGYLGKVLRGEKPCPPHLARALDEKLDAGGEIIAAARTSEQPADAEKIRRSIEDALADGMMSAGLLDDWDTSVTAYGYRTRDTPSPLLLADLTADLAELRLAIGRHRSASALPRLALTAARMSGLVCLTLIKAGDRQAWRRWGRTARHAATEAADGPALSWVAAQEAYGYYYAGDMPGAVACSRTALDATRSPCVGAVLAAALEMRAHAAMGDGRSAMIALETAGQIHARLSGSDLAASAFGYAESQLRFHAGDALTRLGDTRAARPELDRALELCPPEDYTDWALIRLDRAACTAGDGDPDAGLAEAAGTLLALDGPKRQGIITSRGRELLAALTPAQRSSRAAREFRDLLDDTTGMKEIPA